MRDLLEYVVAGRVPEAIVVGFERVHVEQNKRKRYMELLSRVQLGREPLQHGALVGDACHAVSCRQHGECGVMTFELSLVGRQLELVLFVLGDVHKRAGNTIARRIVGLM